MAGSLRDVLLEDVEFDAKRLKHVLGRLMACCAATKQEVTRVVLTPYLLSDNYQPECLMSVLMAFSQVIPPRRRDDKPVDLLIGLAKKLYMARRDKKYSRYFFFFSLPINKYLLLDILGNIGGAAESSS